METINVKEKKVEEEADEDTCQFCGATIIRSVSGENEIEECNCSDS